MFDAWCPTCEGRVLLTARRLRSLEPTEQGHRARLVCWCGTSLTQDIVRTGAAPAAAPDVAPTPVAALDRSHAA